MLFRSRGFHTQLDEGPETPPATREDPWTEEPGRIQPTGLKRVRHMTEQLTLSLSPPFSLFHSIHMQFGVCVAQSNPCPSMELFCEASGWTVCLVQAAAFTRAITDPTTGAIFNPTSLPCFGNKKTCMCFYLQCGRPGFDPWVREIPWRRERLPTPVFWPG